MHDSILEDLNEQQAQAVAHGEGPLMVLAGAGSGKTRVVTRRIARLLRDGVRPGQILALTFTNKAAGEMAQRVAQLGGGFVRVATFHSACARFLRHEGHLLGYAPDYSIYDTHDRDTLIKELMSDLHVSTKEAKPSLIGSWISKLKNAAMKPEDGLIGGSGSDVLQLVERLWTPYHERMRQASAMLIPPTFEDRAASDSRVPSQAGQSANVAAASTKRRMCGCRESRSLENIDLFNRTSSPS